MKIFISASQLKNFMRCPALFYYLEKQGKKKKAIYLERGSKIHDMIANALMGKELPPEEAEYVDGIFSRLTDKIVIWKGAKTQIEKPFSFPWDEYMINGVPDMKQRKDGVANIIDWKTGRNVMGQQDSEDDIQALIYIYEEFLNNPDTTRVFFTFAYTEYGAVKTIVRERGDMEEIKRTIGYRINMFKEAYDNKRFDPEPSAGQCAHCPCLRVCEANVFWKDNDKIQIPTDDTEWLTIYKQLVATKAYLDELDTALKEYCKANQPEKIGEYSIEVGVKSNYSMSTKKETKAYLIEKFPEFTTPKIDSTAILNSISKEQKDELISLGHLTDKSSVSVKIG